MSFVTCLGFTAFAGSSICYYHEWGMNYSHILPNLVVGSVPQDSDDIDYLRNHLGITAILNLQEEKARPPPCLWKPCPEISRLPRPALPSFCPTQDWKKFGIDFGAIQDRCNQLGGIRMVRCPIADFDARSLRAALPGTVTCLASLLAAGHTVYVHCTAGLGRAPGVAITYLHWLFNVSLEEAYSFFTTRRACNPRYASLRAVPV